MLNKHSAMHSTNYVLYRTDDQHSYNSRELLAVCTKKQKAIKLAKQDAKNRGKKINKEQLFNLHDYNQTQGYKGDGEYDIEEVTTNILIV